MAIRKEIKLIAILAVIIIALVSLIDFIKKNVEQADASKFVEEDLKINYPNADVAIMAVTDKINSEGKRYFEIKAKVTNDPDGICPERTHIYYNYPVQNFVPQTPDYITKNCEVCKTGTCVLSFEEEAIIASHTLQGTERIREYISKFSEAHSSAKDSGDGWVIRWNSVAASGMEIEIKLSKNGSVEYIYDKPIIALPSS